MDWKIFKISQKLTSSVERKWRTSIWQTLVYSCNGTLCEKKRNIEQCPRCEKFEINLYILNAREEEQKIVLDSIDTKPFRE